MFERDDRINPCPFGMIRPTPRPFGGWLNYPPNIWGVVRPLPSTISRSSRTTPWLWDGSATFQIYLFFLKWGPADKRDLVTSKNGRRGGQTTPDHFGGARPQQGPLEGGLFPGAFYHGRNRRFADIHKAAKSPSFIQVSGIRQFILHPDLVLLCWSRTKDKKPNGCDVWFQGLACYGPEIFWQRNPYFPFFVFFFVNTVVRFVDSSFVGSHQVD